MKKRRYEEFGPTPTPQLAQIKEIGVGEWCSTQDGSGAPEAVVLYFDIPDTVRCEVVGTRDPILQLGLRLKSRRAVNDVISILEHHMNNVFPIEKE